MAFNDLKDKPTTTPQPNQQAPKQPMPGDKMAGKAETDCGCSGSK